MGSYNTPVCGFQWLKSFILEFVLVLFCLEGTSKVWAVDQEQEKRDLVITPN